MAEKGQYEDFVKAVREAEKELSEVKSMLRSFELADDSDGARISLAQKIGQQGSIFLRDCLIGPVKVLLMAHKSQTERLVASITDGNLTTTMTSLRDGCTQEILQQLLPSAQSPASRDLHGAVKQLELLHDVVDILQGLPMIHDELSEAKAFAKDSRFEEGRSLNCCLATIQALMRPLKSGEQRGQLARRARVMLVAKNATCFHYIYIERERDQIRDRDRDEDRQDRDR